MFLWRMHTVRERSFDRLPAIEIGSRYVHRLGRRGGGQPVGDRLAPGAPKLR